MFRLNDCVKGFFEAIRRSQSSLKDPLKISSKRRHENPRAGIEPIIGHLKNLQMNSTRIKTDKSTQACGYGIA
jgi:hypothetical protein